MARQAWGDHRTGTVFAVAGGASNLFVYGSAAFYEVEGGLGFRLVRLIVIVVVVGVIVASGERAADLLGAAIGAVIVTCLLWWTYFGWLKDALQVQLEREPSATEIQLGRDAFTLLHFPVIGGVIIRSTMQSFTSTLRTLINEGVPLVEALKRMEPPVSCAIIAGSRWRDTR